jgi:tape measure domain-containing protein
MATNLQVNASTQQAVGAFNALAASIANTKSQFDQLNATMSRSSNTASRYAGSVTAINSAFSNLMSMANGALNAIRALGAGLMFVFSSVIKELDKLQGFNAIMSVSTKSATDVSASYNFLRQTADKLGVQFDSLTSNYAKLVAALPPGIKGLQTAEKVFMGTAMAARTLHATNQDTQLMFYALTQMASKGVVSMEELRRQLGEKLPGVMQIAARGLNTLPETLEAAIRKGIVSSEKFLPIFGDALMRTFADSSEKAAQSVSAAIARLSNVWVDFVKNVLDSGSGDAIIGVFDALREKLSDPYLIERFSILIKTLSERVTEFIQNISAEDLRNGFDTTTRAIEMMVEVVGKLIQGITWIINNADKAGAVLGALGGAAVGSLAGPVGAAVGAVGGAAAGYYGGSQLMPTAEQTAARATANQAAEQAKAAQRQQQEMLKFTQLIPLLQQFKGLNSFNGLENLFKSQNLNTKTLADLNRILTGTEFRTDSERAQGVRDYAKFGSVVGPQTNKLSDVFGGLNNRGRKSAEQTALESSEMKAMGLNPNIQRELANYLTLLRSGKLSMDQYSDAVQTLISKQPYMIEYQRQLKDEQTALNKATSDHITFILKQIDAKDELAAFLQEELRLAGMHGEALQVEGQVLAEVNRLKGVGYAMTQQEIAALREKFTVINQTRQISGIEAQILAATMDKGKPQTDMMKALGNLQQNEPGFGKDQAQDYLIQQNPTLFQGTQEAMEAQKRAVQDMYAFIDGLRKADYISEATAAQMKLRANQDAQAQQMSMYSSFFGNLASLQKSGSKKLFEVGKAAAIAQAIIDGVTAVQKAYASVPYPYNIAAAASTAIAVYSNVQQIRAQQAGFMDGGYTGDGPRGHMAGVVHSQEFVVNSAATARNRAALEAMNAGREVAPSSGRSPVTVIVNAPPGSAVEQQQRETPSGTEIEVTIKKVMLDDVRRGGPVSRGYEQQYGLNRAMGAVR